MRGASNRAHPDNQPSVWNSSFVQVPFVKVQIPAPDFSDSKEGPWGAWIRSCKQAPGELSVLAGEEPCLGRSRPGYKLGLFLGDFHAHLHNIKVIAGCFVFKMKCRAVLERAKRGIEALYSAVWCCVYLGKEPETPEFKLRSLSLIPASFGRFSDATGGTVVWGAWVSITWAHGLLGQRFLRNRQVSPWRF